MNLLHGLWILLQVIVGYNLIFPFLTYVAYLFRRHRRNSIQSSYLADYAMIVTAYEETDTLPSVVGSILKMNYPNFLVYIVADKCDINSLQFFDERVIVLRPPTTLASNTRSHQYALDNFVRKHDRLVIIDSDNLVEKSFLLELNKQFDKGFLAVQGLRKPKNLDTVLSCLDAARDIYYHFYDALILFNIGSSATLSGSGMGFDCKLYKRFLVNNQVNGAGFDKVLQAWLLKQNLRIAFTEHAIVFDEKTSRSDQFVQQRSRWINTWFVYFKLGFGILKSGVKTANINQFLFGIILLRPPLFLFLLLSLGFQIINLLFWNALAIVWIAAFFIFILSFLIALKMGRADRRIYKSLLNIPQFIYLQIISLSKINKAAKISVATKHYHKRDDLEE